MKRQSVGILIFDDVEVLDFTGPYEVFAAARLNEERRREEPSPFQVLLVAERPEPVTAQGGLRVVPDHDFGNCPPLDILVVPGGWGTRREIDNQRLSDWLAARAGEVELLCSVCTGAVLLAKAGLLEGKKVTTHWKSLAWLRELVPTAEVSEELQVVEDGDLVTSAGISAGIDLALLVTARCHGETVARATARQMEYPYPESTRRRVPLA